MLRDRMGLGFVALSVQVAAWVTSAQAANLNEAPAAPATDLVGSASEDAFVWTGSPVTAPDAFVPGPADYFGGVPWTDAPAPVMDHYMPGEDLLAGLFGLIAEPSHDWLS